MEKYTFYCKLRTTQMTSEIKRITFNADFFVPPKMNELITFQNIHSYFRDNSTDVRFLPPMGFYDELGGVTCRVVQVVHFDKTALVRNETFNDLKISNGEIDDKAIGILYLDELKDSEEICPTADSLLSGVSKMEKYSFHCQLRLKRMENAIQRLKFNAEFSWIPRINERVMFYQLCYFFLENREEGKRLDSFFSILDFDDPISVTCKVVQVIQFDETTIEEHAFLDSAVVNKKAIGILYLDELECESICPTGAP